MPLITFSSDFGLSDVYVGVVHGVIAGIAPQTPVIDLTHGIPPQDVRAGALALYAGCRHFPAGTIHLAVVDPGVGTERRALLLRSAEYWYVGPDNGLFGLTAPPASLLGCWELTNTRYHLATPSATFHGRDIFAPVAAHLANGIPPEDLGTPAAPPLELPDLSPRDVGPGDTVGAVLAIDHFGNLVTNLRAPQDWATRTQGRQISAWLDGLPLRSVRTYGEAASASRSGDERTELLLLAGSAGLLEVAVANRSAAKASGLGVGAAVRVLMA
jgi:S-adenosyl-L-methionine hydrolase (adenosine-forming)